MKIIFVSYLFLEFKSVSISRSVVWPGVFQPGFFQKFLVICTFDILKWMIAGCKVSFTRADFFFPSSCDISIRLSWYNRRQRWKRPIWSACHSPCPCRLIPYNIFSKFTKHGCYTTGSEWPSSHDKKLYFSSLVTEVLSPYLDFH